MKRSKVVNDIKHLIEANIDTLSEIPDATLLAELILHHLEDIGMAPPFVEKIYIAHAQTSFPKSGHEWEKEE